MPLLRDLKRSVLSLKSTRRRLGLGRGPSEGQTATQSATAPEPQVEIENLDDMDWETIVCAEPEKVVSWITNLHRRQHPGVRSLLSALGNQLLDTTLFANSDDIPLHWRSYVAAHLGSVLMDLAVEGGMMDQDEVNFKASLSPKRIATQLTYLCSALHRIWHTAFIFFTFFRCFLHA